MSAGPLAIPNPVTRLSAIYPYFLLAGCMLMWSGNWILGRALHETMPPIAMTFWRWTVAALILAPIALPRLRGKAVVLKRSWPLLLGLAVTGGAIYQVAVYFGLRHTETVNAVLLNSASPLFIVLATWLVDGERATLRQMLGIALSFAGVIVIMVRGELSQFAAFRFSIGDLAILAVMPLWAFYTVMVRRKPQEIDNTTLIFIISVFGLAALAPFYALETAYFQAAPLAWSTAGTAFYTGAFASVGAYLCWNRGAELVGANRAGFTTHLMPAFTAILAVLLLDEELHPFHAVGIVTILLGVWLATSGRRKA